MLPEAARLRRGGSGGAFSLTCTQAVSKDGSSGATYGFGADDVTGSLGMACTAGISKAGGAGFALRRVFKNADDTGTEVAGSACVSRASEKIPIGDLIS